MCLAKQASSLTASGRTLCKRQQTSVCHVLPLLQAGPGQPPDVWLQLWDHAADDICHPAITRQLVRQLVLQEDFNTQQQT